METIKTLIGLLIINIAVIIWGKFIIGYWIWENKFWDTLIYCKLKNG